MPQFNTLSSVFAMTLALSSVANGAALQAGNVPCTAYGPADEFYYRLSGHSAPLYGVQIDNKTNILTGVKTRDTNDQFLFEKCDAPSTGYVQNEPITEGLARDHFGHVRHVATGKCLRHRDDIRDFILDDCPTKDKANLQLPFWFETNAKTSGVVRFTGYKNTTAYPQPVWFAGAGNKVPFSILTEKGAENGQGDPNEWVLARPIRV